MKSTAGVSPQLDTDIAIVGMDCRFPGANSLDEYWELLREGRCAVRELPADRWDADEFYSPDAKEPGRINSRKGGYIRNPALFDAGFFNVAPREARRMDPQQRILLEVTWHALEDANIVPGALCGTHTGVFVGVMGCEWGRIQFADLYGVDGLTGPGSHDCISPNRVSYHFDLKGPSVAYATACSSSLVSIHAAMRSLQLGECSLAVAGGVNLVMHPGMGLFYTKAGLSAPDGVCKPFSRNADGLGRSDGVGVVVLKLLSQALADGDRIHAVLRGGAVNQDGRSNGLTAPSRLAQEDLLRRAFANAQVQPQDLQYIEAHGTGTVLGDLIEGRALGSLMSGVRDESNPCYIGSVKGNMSHLEGAAGVASVIKVALALQHAQIPASLHSADLNPEIPFDEYRLRVPQRLQDWPDTGGRPRLAGVSGFGIGGTNAHLVLAQAPQRPADSPAVAGTCALPALLSFSAKSEAALREYAQGIDRHFDEHPDVNLAAFCDTFNACRSHFPVRAALVVSGMAQLRKALRAFTRKAADAGGLTVATAQRKPPRIAFVFTGQGAHYPGMGQALHAREPVFRKAIDDSCASFERLTGGDLKKVLFEDAALQKRASLLQPALFVFGHALAQLWRAWGVHPTHVLGHSLGEYAAACASGRIGFDDALALVARRGALIESLGDDGGMLAVDAGEEALKAYLQGRPASVVIAADNTPGMCAVAGPKAELALLRVFLAAKGHRVTELPVSHAFHSPQMEPILGAFEAFADGIEPCEPAGDIRFISNVTGREVARETPLRGKYWATQIREPVRFRECVLEAQKAGCNLFLEIGPAAVLTTLIRAAMGNQVSAITSLDRNRDDWSQLLQALGQMHCLGAQVDLRRGRTEPPDRLLALPKYPFQHQSLPLHVVDETVDPSWRSHKLPGPAAALRVASMALEPSDGDQPESRSASVNETILAALARVSGMEASEIQAEQRLVDDLGFSSLMMIEMTSTLGQQIPQIAAIPLSFYFKGGTVAELLRKCGEGAAGGVAASVSTDAPIARDATPPAPVATPVPAPVPVSALEAAIACCNAWEAQTRPGAVIRVTPDWVHQLNERNVLLARQQQVSALMIAGQATQDLTHPFFFDHSQDHIPGMYVIEAVRQLITASASLYLGVDASRKFVLMELGAQFESFAEVDSPFFMALDYSGSHFQDGLLTYIDSVTHIVQRGRVIGQVRGRGRVMASTDYRSMRGERSHTPTAARTPAVPAQQDRAAERLDAA